MARKKIALARGPEDVDGGGGIREHPNVTTALPQFHFGFIDMQHRTGDQFRKH
jgi:hypothetical protein